MRDFKATQGWGALILAALILAAGAIWLAWRGLGALSLTTLKALILILAVATPGAFWAGWRLGSREAKATLHGIDEVANRVMSAAEHVAALRVGMQRARKQDGPVVVMPLALPPIVRRSGDGGQDVIDL